MANITASQHWLRNSSRSGRLQATSKGRCGTTSRSILASSRWLLDEAVREGEVIPRAKPDVVNHKGAGGVVGYQELPTVQHTVDKPVRKRNPP